MRLLSLVIPVYNEAESLPELHAEISAVCVANQLEAEIIFIDDGSTDNSWAAIEALAAKDKRIRGLRFRRNFGKAAALAAGFEEAKGEIIFTLDADLQDDPKEIPRFLEQIDAGYDLVSGWKEVRHDPWHKTGPSKIFNWMVSWLTGVSLHDHNCGFKCYRRQIFEEVHLYGELHRFVPVLAASHGWKVGEIVVHHRERKHGESKYGVFRMVKGFLDLLTVYFLTGYDRRPQHLLGGFGLFCFFCGMVTFFILACEWVLSRVLTSWFTPPVWFEKPIHLHESALFYVSGAALLLGAQFIVTGFLAELITFHLARDNKPYSISGKTVAGSATFVPVPTAASASTPGAPSTPPELPKLPG